MHSGRRSSLLAVAAVVLPLLGGCPGPWEGLAGCWQGASQFTIYNYTSPLEGPELSWLEGQTGETRIVRVDVWLP